MSENVSFLYPITRVGSLYQLLRTTAHSAFPVVTPLSSHSKPLKNMTSLHMPTLYKEDFTLSKVYEAEGANTSPHDSTPLTKHVERPQPSRNNRTTFIDHPSSSYSRHMHRKCGDQANVCSAQLYDSDGLEYTYPIPSSSEGAHESFQMEKVKEDTPLVLHGMILRTQLIQLLKHRVFFSDNDQASH